MTEDRWPGDERERLETALGHRFTDAALFERALTHRSFANEHGHDRHNERLEFLGDAVLGVVTAEWLFVRHPERPEGELARAKSALVSASALSGWANHLNLGRLLRLGVGETRSGGRRRASMLADALEALFGAAFLDGDLDAARIVIGRYLEWAEGSVEWRRSDPKTELQERVQARGWSLPIYRVVEESGPDHEKRFTCEVAVRDEPLARGAGRTKKAAQVAAATRALAILDETRADSADQEGPVPADASLEEHEGAEH